MRYLRDPHTRAARLAVLRRRWDAFRFGDEIAEPFLASLCSIYGLVLLFPGDTTSHATAWRVLREIFDGDMPLGVVFTIFAVSLWLSAFQLVPFQVKRIVLLATFSLWVGMAVAFAFGFILSLGPYLCVLYAGVTWLAYTRLERERL